MECVEFEASLEKVGGATVLVKKPQLATTYSTKSQNHLHMCTTGFPDASLGLQSFLLVTLVGQFFHHIESVL